MRTIFKYQLKIGADTELMLPEGCEILCVAPQRHLPQLWALIDTDRPPVARKFAIIGTGWPVPENARYISTFQTDNPAGTYVWHTFEVS